MGLKRETVSDSVLFSKFCYGGSLVSSTKRDCEISIFGMCALFYVHLKG